MMLIFGLMLLLQTAACLELNCSFNQSDPCYTALGHKLNLLMVLDASKYDLKIMKRINNTKHDPVCRVRYGRMRMSECDLYKNRSEVTVINGLLIINRVIRADSGNYRLTLESSDGTETSKRDLQVIVEAPIGSVEVSIICSSNQTSVFCSSDGDQIIYSWTLNGDPLMDGNSSIDLNERTDGNSSIDLNERTDGNISCSVKNHVSHAQKTIRLQPCPAETTTAAVTTSLTSAMTSTMTSAVTPAVTGSTQTPEYGTSFSSAGTNQTLTQSPDDLPWKFYLIALGCAALIVLLLFITVCYVYKKKQSTPAAAGDTELIYSDISPEKKSEKKKTESLPAAEEEYATVRLQTKRKKVKEEEEVQYGEVTFTPKNSVAPQQPQEECVYSQVQRR